MSKLGGWEFNPSVTSMPQKVIVGLEHLKELLGAKYKYIAYLGKQEVNGTNYAVLVEQTVITGEDVKNAAIAVFNEKPNSTDVALVDIFRIVDGGGKLGGTNVNMTTEIPEEAQKIFDEALSNFIGSNIKPIAFVGTKVVKGIDYKFVATIAPVVPNAVTDVVVVTVNSFEKAIKIEKIF